MLTLPSSYSSPERYTDDLCAFIASPLVRQLTGGIHVNDALIYDAWGKLPEEWTKWWAAYPDHRLAQQDLIDYIGQDAEPGLMVTGRLAQSQPESLTIWLDKLRSLALPRTQRDGPVVDLPDVLKFRMDNKVIKKMNEVSRAAAYIHGVCRRKEITHIVDMGSGQGYLSVSLAYLFPHLKILAIDGSKSQVAGSHSFAVRAGVPETRLKHLVHWIDGSAALATNIEDWADGKKCMLVGLHACGNLSEYMLRYFATVPCIDAVASIGCCYNHIVPRSPGCPEGFPISAPLRHNNVTLSPTALMTACQAPNNWGKPDAEGRQGKAKSDFSRRRLYRAILEKMFFDKGIKTMAENRPAWGTRKGDLTDFVTFAQRSMEYLRINEAEVTNEELLVYEERYKACEGQISILWTLGVLCGRVVESLIAMDRYWYLRDMEADKVGVLPVFDPKISPRNLMIVGEKNTAKHSSPAP